MSCGVGRRCGLDLALLWLWSRLTGVALIRTLAWEPPYALGVALKKSKQKKKRPSFKKSHFIQQKLIVYPSSNTVKTAYYMVFLMTKIRTEMHAWPT